MADPTIEIRFLGALEVRTPHGQAALPPSKKARALLCYLALTGRAHSRTKLANIFWEDIIDDPRGGLRWCLSKVRSVLGDKSIIVADRSTVGFDSASVWIDVHHVKEQVDSGLDGLSVAQLTDLAAHFRGELLEGLHFDELHAVQAWLTAQRGEARALHRSILLPLANRLRDEPDEAVIWWRRLAQLEPYHDETRAGLFSALKAAHRLDEAEDEYQRALRDLEGSGSSTYALHVARRAPSNARVSAPRRATAKTRAQLFGRTQELRDLEHAMQGAESGRGSAVLLSGEAGVGKTRLVGEFAAHCEQRGVVVLRGGSVSAEGAPSYTPFAEALASLPERWPQIYERQDLGLLAEVMPTIQIDMENRQRAASESHRYAVFHAITDVLCEVAEPRGLLLVIEDTHWADRQSLLLLTHLVRHVSDGRIMILATYRGEAVAQGPLRQVHATLLREGARPLALERLPRNDATAMIVALLRELAPAPDTDLEAVAPVIFERTAGHPFFIEETVKHLAESDVLTDPASWAAMGLPDGVRDLIEHRLDRLGRECDKMLAAASVIVGPIEWPVLVGVCGRDEDELLDLLDEALDSQILREHPQRRGSYEFGHALIRQALYDALTPSRRVRLHRKLIGVIEQAHRSKLEPHLVTLAYHAHEVARGSNQPELLVEYTKRAARSASQHKAHDVAAELFERALGALEDIGHGWTEEESELHSLAGDERGTLCEWKQARDHYVRGLATLPAESRAARARLLLRWMHAQYRTRDTTGCEEALQEALRLGETEQLPRIAEAARGFLLTLGLANGTLAPVEDLEVIQFDVEELTAEPLLAQSRAHHPARLYFAARFSECVAASRTLIRVAEQIDDPMMRMNLLPKLGLSLGALGQYRESEEVFEEARRYGTDHKIGALLARSISMSAGNCADLADYSGLRARAIEAHDLASRVGFKPTIVSARLDLLNAAIGENERAEAERLFDQITQDVSDVVGWHGWIWALRRSLADAKMKLLRSDWFEAAASATRAIQQAEQAGRIKYEIEGRWVRASAYVALGRPADATSDLTEASELARQIGHTSYLLRSLALTHELLDDDALLGELRTLAVEIEDELDGPMRDAFRARFVRPIQALRER